MSNHLQIVKTYFDKPARYLKHSFSVVIRSQIVSELLGKLENKDILDVGCGDGTISLQFQSETNTLTLIDLSNEMLMLANKQVALELQANVTFIQHDFQTWEPDRLFDVVICIGVLGHVTDVELAYNQLAKFVKPGGCCILQFTNQDALIAKIIRIKEFSNHYAQSIHGYSFNYLSFTQMYELIQNSSLSLAKERRYSLLLPGMGNLPNSMLYAYSKFVLRHNWLTKLGTEVIMYLIKEDESKIKDNTLSKEQLPIVSIVMPIRNEESFISRSFGAIMDQDYPHDRLEVLVVDGISTDGTRALLEQQIARHKDISVKILDNPKRIVPTGMNLALRQATGDVIVRVDGHCEIALDYVSRCVQHLRLDKVDGVGGPIETRASTSSGESIALAMGSRFGVGGSSFRTTKGRKMLVDTVAFPAYTRHAMDVAGPYDEELVRNQDDEYNYRLRRLGFKLMLCPDISSHYYSRVALSSLWRQYYQYGYYKVRVMQKHPYQMQARQFIPPLFVLSMLGSAVLAVFNTVGRSLGLFIASLYIIANLIASTSLASKYGWSHFIRLPIIFSILHISYGLGFLVGLIRFAHRWSDRSAN